MKEVDVVVAAGEHFAQYSDLLNDFLSTFNGQSQIRDSVIKGKSGRLA
jgi:hypothetical protein